MQAPPPAKKAAAGKKKTKEESSSDSSSDEDMETDKIGTAAAALAKVLNVWNFILLKHVHCTIAKI